jgi:N-acyl-D-aspartate/D-glutamate deacylase
MIDLAIANALIYDGSGMPPQRGTVSIDAGRVVAVGGETDRARTKIDADGLTAAPGFIDPHTHYDPHLFWDGHARPSMEHGITTVVTGNCSLSLAPVRADAVRRLSRMFGKIEELPAAAFDEGVDWSWATFPEYLAALEPRLAMNVAPLVGHSALRMWVMGEDAAHRAATDDEVAFMQLALQESLAAGAAGLSISYVDVDENLQPVPSRLADHDELRALVSVLGRAGGVLQVVPEYWSTARCLGRVDQLAELSSSFGIPTTFSPLLYTENAPELPASVMERVREHARRGARVIPQVQTRPISANFRLSGSVFPMNRLPAWREVSDLATKDAKRDRFTDPASRAVLVAAAYHDASDPVAAAVRDRLDHTSVIATPHEKSRDLVGRSLPAIAADRGITSVDAMIDISLENDLEVEFRNDRISHHDVDVIGPLLADPFVLIGASDAGAHVRTFASTGDTGYLFSRFVRECGYLGVSDAVRRITFEPAAVFGLADRGLLRSGYAADVVVFDPDTIARGEEVGVTDLPGDGYRYVRHAVGIHTVIVNGEITYTEADGYTDRRPGVIASRRLTPS